MESSEKVPSQVVTPCDNVTRLSKAKGQGKQADGELEEHWEGNGKGLTVRCYC
jgi:hypothetical protein